MKQLKEVPAAALDAIKDEHQRALDEIFSNTHSTYHMPMHIVAMRIMQPDKHVTIERVIIPAVVIHLTGDAFIAKDTLDVNCIKYTLQGTHRPFPFGHIYQDSGHVCLGDIFVPSAISCHTPQQPLETLFLYNDRNVRHGDSRIIVSAAQIGQIKEMLRKEDIQLPDNFDTVLQPEYNLVQNDAVWSLSAFVLQNAPTKAFAIMQQIFDIIFLNK